MFVGDIDASEATNSKLVLAGSTDATFDLSRLVATDTTANNEFINFTRLGKEGTSTWTLTGTTSGNHSWSIKAGKLIGNTTTIKGNADIASGASLEFNQTTDGTYAGSLSGSGALVKSGGGTLVLNGSNGYFSGSTAIDAGTVEMRDSLALGSGPIANNTGLALSFSSTFSNTVTGAGDVTVDAGSGTVEFTTAKAHTGLTTVISGILKLDALNAIFDSMGLEVEQNAGIAATSDQTFRHFRLDENTSASFNHNSLTLEEGTIKGNLADVADLNKISNNALALNADVTIAGNLSHQAGEITIADGKTLSVGGVANFAVGSVLNSHPGTDPALRADSIVFAGSGPIIDLIGYASTDSYVVAEAANGTIGTNYQVKIGGARWEPIWTSALSPSPTLSGKTTTANSSPPQPWSGTALPPQAPTAFSTFPSNSP